MFKLVAERPGICTLGYDDSVNAVVITWLINDDDVFRPMLEEQLRLVLLHGAASVIVDTAVVKGVLNSANQAWMAKDFFPRMSVSGVRALISVVPESAIALMLNRRSFRDREVGFSMVEVASLAEAMTEAARYNELNIT